MVDKDATEYHGFEVGEWCIHEQAKKPKRERVKIINWAEWQKAWFNLKREHCPLPALAHLGIPFRNSWNLPCWSLPGSFTHE